MELRARLTSEQDRLAVALFVAALLHGLLILGLRFTSPPTDGNALPTLEVLLVPDGPPQELNKDASYIAQRNQLGTGTTRDADRTSLPESVPAFPDPGEVTEQEGTSTADSDAADGPTALTARAIDASRAAGGGSTAAGKPMPLEMQTLPQLGLNSSAAGPDVILRGKEADSDMLLADTRESQIASYLDSWKRRIERVGTLNFPNEARRRSLSGNPVVEVAIAADGKLNEVLVRRTSGFRELDQAAVNIVRLASPFDPLPTAARARYPVLRFAYEWQFLNGRLGGAGTVRADADAP